MKCLYAGCKTAEEAPSNTFHKVVGSCGRDGKSLYICSEHFEKLKSSKSPSLVSCKQPVVKSAAVSRKENNQEENVNLEERENDMLLPMEINQEVNEGNPEGNNDVTEKIEDYLELKAVVMGPAHDPCQSSSVRRKIELKKDGEEERERNKFDQGENKDNFEGKNKSILELKTVRVGPAHEPFRSASFPSILRRKRDLRKDREENNERKRYNEGENKGNKVIEKDKKSIVEPKTIRIGPVNRPCQSVLLSSVHRRKIELKEDQEPEEYNQGATVLVEEEKSSIQERRTVRTLLGHTRGFRPPIIRKKREVRGDKLLEENASKNYHQRETGVWKDNQGQDEAKKHSQEGNEVKKINQEEMSKEKRYPSWLLDKFICVDVQHGDVSEAACQTLPTLPPPHQQPLESSEHNQEDTFKTLPRSYPVSNTLVEMLHGGVSATASHTLSTLPPQQQLLGSNEHNQEETDKMHPHSFPHLDKFRGELQRVGVSATASHRLPTVSPPQQPPLEGNKHNQEETCQTNSHFYSHEVICVDDIDEHGSSGATTCHTLPPPHQPQLEANEHSKEENKDKCSLQKYEMMKQSIEDNKAKNDVEGNEANLYYLVVKKHSLEGTAPKKCYLVKKNNLDENPANKHYLKVKKPRLEGNNAGNKHSLEGNAENEHSLMGNAANELYLDGNSANEHNLAVKRHSKVGNVANKINLEVEKHSLAGNATNKHSLEGNAENEYSLVGNAANELYLDGNSANEHNLAVKHRSKEGNVANKINLEVKNHCVEGNAANKPSLEGNAANKPSLEGNAANKPCLEGNAANKPSLEENAANKPCLEGNAANKPSLEANATNKPSLKGNAANKPSLDENAANKPCLEGNAANKPSLEGNAANKPSLEGNAANKSGLEGNTANKSSLDGSAANKPSLEGNAANKSGLEGNAANKPSLEGNAANKSSLEGNAANKPNLEGNAANKPGLEGNAANKPSLEGNTANKSSLDGSAANKPSLEGNAANKPSLEGNAANKPSLEGNEGNAANKINLDEYVVKKQKNVKLYENKNNKNSQCDNEASNLHLEENEALPGLEGNKAGGNGQEESAGNPDVEETDENNLHSFPKSIYYRSCSAAGCNVTYPDEKLFRFPSDPKRMEMWCRLAYGKYIGRKVGYMCARHFRVEDFRTPDRLKLNRGVIPTYPTGPLNPITQDYCPFEDSEAVYCSAVNCGLSQKTHPRVSFTPFPPKSDSRYQEWWKVAGEVRNPRYLCARHFDATQFNDDSRTYIKPRAIPKYKSGLYNPETNNYAPLQDDSENSSDSCTAAISAVSPAVAQNIQYAAISPDDGQNIQYAAISPAVGQIIRISAASSPVDQKIKVTGASPSIGQNLQIASVSSLSGQNIKIAGAGSVLSKNINVTASPSGAGLIIKLPAASVAAKPGQSCLNKTNDPLDDADDDEMDAVYKRCDAVDCPSSYKNDPKVKYFTFPAKTNNSSAAEKKRRQHWMDVVGGTKDGRARFLCQYHFAADTFIEKTRTTLVRRANPLFPYGPLNPVTKDYCPIGEEQRSLSSRDFLRARCCVDGCTTYSFNTSGLFGFPIHDREAYEEWTKRVGVYKYFTEQHIRMKFRICPKHFSSCCTIVDQGKNSVHLKFGALPTINVPCFKGPPNEINSFVQNRTLSTDEIEALKMLSESDRVCDLNDICDKENDEETSLELKRKISDAKAVPNKKSKNDSAAADPNKQLILLPIQDENGQQTYVLADFGSNENFASISGQNQNVEPQEFNASDPLSVQEPTAEKVVDKSRLSKLMKTRVCTYWSPDSINDKEAVTKKREVAHRERLAQLGNNKGSSNVANQLPSSRNKNIRVSSKGKTAKEMYEDFSMGIQEDNVGNEVDIDLGDSPEQTVNNVKPPVLPTEKTDNTETALLKIFGSCEASDDNVFSCFIDSSKVPDHEEGTSVHSYCSSNSLNVIRSAAELCEFNDLKMKQLESLIGIREDTASELEQILIRHLSSVMCITGVDFLKKCFDQVLKEAVVKKKAKDEARRFAHSKSEPSVPLNERYPADTRKLAVALQTFSGKAYHAMTQLIDLPSQSITRDWTCHKNGDPGFSDRAFKVLKEEAYKRGVVTVSLGMEEVPLKQDVSWDGERTFGFTDLGYGAVDYDYIPEATRAVVFFATALNRTWKIPLGYCLADNLTASVRANLVIQYLYKIADSGVKCIALVCNYSLVTYQMLIELGAISEEYYAPLTGSFPHPLTKGDRVHCFVDIHQLMKSVNTLWAEKKAFSFKNKDEIEWSHMNRMSEFIQSDNKFPNPGYENVYNDLLSLKCLIKRDPRSSYKYNALVLDLLKNLGLDGFENVSGTAAFLDKLHSITELFSSCHPHDHGERRPLTKGNLSEVTQKLNSVIAYFNNLSYSDGTKVMTSQRKLPVVLLFSNITSLKTMIKKVFTVDKYKLVNIKTESLNLDCLHQTLVEMTDGKEGLLTPLEFKKAFFNFVETINLEPSSQVRVRQKAKETTPLPVESSLGFSNAFSYQFTPVSTVCESVHEFFTENVIENWLQVAHCTDCSQLIQKEMLKYGNHDSKGNVIEDIHRMLRMAETILAELDEIPMDAFTSWFDKLANKTLNSLTSLKGFKNNSHLFNSKPFGEVTHFTLMVKDMLRIFLRLRLCFLSRQEKIRIKPPRQYSLRFCLGRSWA